MGELAWAALLSDLYGLAPRGIQPGLGPVREALGRIGDPQGSFDVVHIAGTNGKGSAAAMIADGVVGAKVGRFTSPHLHSLTERFVIDGEPVARAVVIETWERLRAPVAQTKLTFFETVTVLAFAIFEHAGVELAVLETGLGGRLDATNVCQRKRVTALTRVALDHQAWLGDDLATIAMEKAGIMAPGVPCVVGPQVEEVDTVIACRAADLGAPLIRPTHDGPAHALRITCGDRVSKLLSLSLPGAHQRENAAVAAGVLFRLEQEGASVDLDRALRARWPARLERLPRRPAILLDVAHNPDAAAALARHLEAEPTPPVLVFGAMRDKDWPAMLAALRPRSLRVVLTKARLGRAQEPAEMAAPGDLVEPQISQALLLAQALAGPEGLVVVAGSSFVVADARAHLLGISADPPIAF